MNGRVIRTKRFVRLKITLKIFLALVFAVTICIYISPLASLINILKGILTSTIGLNIWKIIANIKKYKLIIKKKKKKYDEITLLAKINYGCIILI